MADGRSIRRSCRSNSWSSDSTCTGLLAALVNIGSGVEVDAAAARSRLHRHLGRAAVCTGSVGATPRAWPPRRDRRPPHRRRSTRGRRPRRGRSRPAPWRRVQQLGHRARVRGAGARWPPPGGVVGTCRSPADLGSERPQPVQLALRLLDQAADQLPGSHDVADAADALACGVALAVVVDAAGVG